MTYVELLDADVIHGVVKTGWGVAEQVRASRMTLLQRLVVVVVVIVGIVLRTWVRLEDAWERDAPR